MSKYFIFQKLNCKVNKPSKVDPELEDGDYEESPLVQEMEDEEDETYDDDDTDDSYEPESDQAYEESDG